MSDGTTKVRIRSFRVAPDHSYIILLIDAATKLVDRFEIAPRTLVQVDLETHEVVREIAWPDDEERISVNMLFSPNGDLLYLFGQEIIALDTVDFQEIERWQLSQLEEGGLGHFDFGFRVDVNEEPGFFSGVFRVQDPVQNRSLMGIARINLADRDIDFYTLGQAERVSSFFGRAGAAEGLWPAGTDRAPRVLDLRPRGSTAREQPGLRRPSPHEAQPKHQRTDPLCLRGRQHN